VIEIGHLSCKRGSLADRKYKEKEQRGRFGEIDEKISCEEYTLDRSQSKVFLVKEDKIKKKVANLPSSSKLKTALLN